ncbi:MAG: phospholipase D-like domain-containing protein [Desulfobacterales bacterium]|nr:phospholipase D-like domain-containing protein [Desulfobacterales bacterium]
MMVAPIRRSSVLLSVIVLLFIPFLVSHFTIRPATAGHGRLNVNTATAAELELLPFIGIKKARMIIDYRSAHGPFTSLEQLLESRMIGPETFAAMAPYLKISGPSDPDIRKDSGAAGHGPSRLRRLVLTRPGQIRILPDREYFELLLPMIQRARHKIRLTMFLFRTTDSPNNLATAVAKALIKARRRGVAVRVLLERSGFDDSINSANRTVAAMLHKNHIQVRFDSRAVTTHAKLVVIDQRYVFVGSHNLTHSALTTNHEFSLLVDSRDLAAEVLDYLDSIELGRGRDHKK